jgi:hypothetical protein
MSMFRNFFESAPPDEIDVLRRRMTMLRLDVDAWPAAEPAMLADMQQSCAACASRSRCAYDLLLELDEPTWRDWRDYCPNAARLRTLVALQGFLKKNLTIDRAIERLGDHPQVAPIETD